MKASPPPPLLSLVRPHRFTFFPPYILISASSHCSLSQKCYFNISLSQWYWVSSPSFCGEPDRASLTPPRLTSLDRPTTAARPSMPSRSVSVRSFRLHSNFEPLKWNGLFLLRVCVSVAHLKNRCVDLFYTRPLYCLRRENVQRRDYSIWIERGFNKERHILALNI